MDAFRPAPLCVAWVILMIAAASALAAPKASENTAAVSASVPQKPIEKKGKDFVGRANEKKDRGGLYRFESGAYRFTTDVDKDLANDIAAHMDEVYKEYDRRFRGFKPNPYAAVKTDEKMPLYILRRYKDYLTLLGNFGVNAANSSGVFFRTAKKQSGLATWVEGQSRLKMYYVLQHEGFHQFADARIMFDLPPWVNEGVAEYFGDAIMVNRQLVVGKLDEGRLERMKAAAAKGETLPFKKLMTMNSKAWVERVTSGDKAAALMYDSAWSACYFLVHGGKRNAPLQTKIDGQAVPALEAYLRILNADFVRDPRTDKRPNAFNKVFSNELGNFEAAWKDGLKKLEPDPWFSSVRHLQLLAAALKQFHAKKIEVKSWPQLKEQMARHRFRTAIRERDAVSRGNGDDKSDDALPRFDFSAPAEVEFLPSADPRVPAGLFITKVNPNILLSWTVNSAGEIEEDISFIDPNKVRRSSAPVARKVESGRETLQSATPSRESEGSDPKSMKADQPTTRRGVIRIGQ